MIEFAHPLNIGTLAAWLSVAGFGTVAVIIPNRLAPSTARPEVLESQWLPQDFTLGGDASPAAEEPSSEPPAADPAEILPAPPEMPDLTELDPLPEVPEPPPLPTPAASGETSLTPRPPARTDARIRSSRQTTRNPASSGASAGTGQSGGGTAMGNAARLAAGSMPSPVYPAEARRRGQTGTLLVEFTVAASGRVISAYAKSPSPWPLLNQEAVTTVRRWKFPPGPVMKLQRSIVFQLR